MLYKEICFKTFETKKEDVTEIQHQPNKLAACPFLRYLTGESSLFGTAIVSGLQGDTILPSLSLSSSVEKLVGNKAL